jgi:hypothetical protein
LAGLALGQTILGDVDEDGADTDDAGGDEEAFGGMEDGMEKGFTVVVEAEGDDGDVEEEEEDVEDEKEAADSVEAGELIWYCGYVSEAFRTLK